MKKWLKRQIIMMKNYVCINKRYTHLYIIAGFFIIAGTIAGFAYSFALPEEISEVVIDSDNYGGLGSYRVKKSASWIETNQAKITFDFDSIQKTSDKRYDVILVLDTSASMFGDKLSKLKEDSKELVKYILKDSYNRVGLISFQKTSNILSGFTNDEEAILHIINGLSADGSTNYYDALVNADTILNDYQLEDNKECILLFLTDGYPNVKTPNEVGEYQYLKSEYPFLKINAVQYEMGNDILEPITKISDKQFVADMENLHNVLFDASIEVTSYERIEIVDYINSEYFYVKDEKDIHPSVGTVKLENEGGKQKVIWIIDNIPSGVKTSLEIVVEVKKSSIETEDVVYMPTNEKEIVTTKLENEEEKVQESNLTPILKNYYDVIYDLNLPDTCDMKSIPSVKYLYGVSVPINDDLSNCGNYRFEGWDMITSNVKIYNDDSFVMPDKEVKLVAIWEKIEISKSMNGTVYDKITGAEKLISKVGTGGLVEETHPATSQLQATTDYRYTGKDPENYIKFNEETWRIIGVFDVDDGTGSLEKRIKIIREPLEKMSWDANNVNNWNKATSKVLFNEGHYYDRTGSYVSNGLTEKAKSQIVDAKWYLGGADDYSNLLVSNWYNCERETNVYLDNPISWIGKVGLMYPSDYGYATSGGDTTSREECLATNLYEWRFSTYSDCNTQNWLYDKNNNQWTITPVSSNVNYVHYVTNVGGVNGQYGTAGFSTIMMRPSVYLRSDLRLVGEGTRYSPYEIKNFD